MVMVVYSAFWILGTANIGAGIAASAQNPISKPTYSLTPTAAPPQEGDNGDDTIGLSAQTAVAEQLLNRLFAVNTDGVHSGETLNFGSCSDLENSQRETIQLAQCQNRTGLVVISDLALIQFADIASGLSVEYSSDPDFSASAFAIPQQSSTSFFPAILPGLTSSDVYPGRFFSFAAPGSRFFIRISVPSDDGGARACIPAEIEIDNCNEVPSREPGVGIGNPIDGVSQSADTVGANPFIGQFGVSNGTDGPSPGCSINGDHSSSPEFMIFAMIAFALFYFRRRVRLRGTTRK